MRYTERRDAMLRALAAAHGAAKQRFLATSEHCRRTLGRMVADGIVVRHPQHVIALPGTERPTIIARRLGGLIACAHAMEHYGIALQESPGSRLHIIAPYDQHPVDGIGRVIIHRNAGAPIDPLGSPFADQETAILTFMRCTSELDALIALDCALRGGLVTRAQLLARLRGPRNGPMRALLARADPKARSLHPGDRRRSPLRRPPANSTSSWDSVLRSRPTATPSTPPWPTGRRTAAATSGSCGTA